MIPTKTYYAASMRQDVDTPRHGARGSAWRVPGAVDSRAFLFQPDGDPNAYYCEESDLAFSESEKDLPAEPPAEHVRNAQQMLRSAQAHVGRLESSLGHLPELYELHADLDGAARRLALALAQLEPR